CNDYIDIIVNYQQQIFPPPEPLNSLLIGDQPKHGEFKRNIRRNFMPIFKVQGLQLVYWKRILSQ
ncbi:ATP-dependent DNA helicase, partial [Aphis craccivora]